jgi:hypothetical protein
VAQGGLKAPFAALAILRPYLSLVCYTPADTSITGSCAQLDANWSENGNPSCGWVLFDGA